MDYSTRSLSDERQSFHFEAPNAITSNYTARIGTDLPPSLPSGEEVDRRIPIRSSCPWSKHDIEDEHGFQVIGRYYSVTTSVTTTEGKVLIMGGWTPYQTVSDGNVYQINNKEPFSITAVQTIPFRQRGPAIEPFVSIGHSGILSGNAFIIWGGADSEGRFNDSLYLLNIDTNEWSKAIVESPPTQRHGQTLQRMGTKLYLHGGVKGEVYFDDLYSFDLKYLKMNGIYAGWVNLTSGRKRVLGGPMPSPRASHTAACNDHEMYLFGGTNGVECFNDVWLYSALLDDWSELSVIGAIPQPRQRHTSAIIDGVLYIFGGCNKAGEALAELAALRIEERRWYTFANTNMGASPSPRWGHTMTVASKRIVLFGGGSGRSSSSDSMDNSIYVLDSSKVHLNHPTRSEGLTTDSSVLHNLPKVAGTLLAGKESDFKLVRRDSKWSMATEITKVTQSHKISTTLELDVYFAKPYHHNFTSREAKLDTQADGNFISETLVEFLGYEIRPYQGPGFHTAGGIVNPRGETSIFFEWQQSKKLRKRKFLVLEGDGNLPCDLVLGINFINEFEVYKLNVGFLVLALAPMSSERKQEYRDRAKAQREQGEADERAEEEAFRAKREEVRRGRQEMERQRSQLGEEKNE